MKLMLRTSAAVAPLTAPLPAVPPPLPLHLRQDKLYIKENEGILHEVKISPAAYRRDVPCSCP